MQVTSDQFKTWMEIAAQAVIVGTFIGGIVAYVLNSSITKNLAAFQEKMQAWTNEQLEDYVPAKVAEVEHKAIREMVDTKYGVLSDRIVAVEVKAHSH